MFDSKKLEKFAISIFPYMSDDRIKEQLSNAITSYGVDSGEALLEFVLDNFKESFVRQFFNGTDEEFVDVYATKLVFIINKKYKKPSNSYVVT